MELELPYDSNMLARKCIEEQCNVLGIPIYYLDTDYEGKVEKSVLSHFINQGYYGKHCEGSYIFLVIHAMCLDKLHLYNTFNSRMDACNRYLKAQFQLQQSNIQDILSGIRTLPSHVFRNNAEEILCEKLPMEIYPDVDVELLQEILEILGRDKFYEIAELIAKDPYGLCRGWPDLILYRDDEIKFVEVKHNDVLHQNQLYTLYHIGKILKDISVTKVTGKKVKP